MSETEREREERERVRVCLCVREKSYLPVFKEQDHLLESRVDLVCV